MLPRQPFQPQDGIQPPPQAQASNLFDLPSSSFSFLRLFLSLNVLLIFLLVAAWKRASPIAVKARRKGTSTVLLVGPLASGKTALFSKLVYGNATQTHTSIKENEGLVKAKWGAGESEQDGEKARSVPKDGEEPPAVPLSTPLHLVDLPGHPRLRTRSLAQYLPAADGIVFAVDASSGLTGKNARDAGDWSCRQLQSLIPLPCRHFHILLSLLASLSLRRSILPPILILLTKSDLLSASSSAPSSSTASPSSKIKSPTLALDRAKQSLLRELERRRLAATGSGGSTPSSVSTGRLSAGAKLEGLEAIPGGASNGGGGAIQSLLAAVGLSAPSSSFSTSQDSRGEVSAGLPSDEGEVLSNEDVFGFEGPVEWEKLERAVGNQIGWALGSVKMGKDGVGEVWEFVEGL